MLSNVIDDADVPTNPFDRFFPLLIDGKSRLLRNPSEMGISRVSRAEIINQLILVYV